MPTKRSPRKLAQDCLDLPACQSADLRRSGAGREGRIEHVDIDAEIDRRVAHHFDDAFDHGGGTGLMDTLRRQHHHATRRGPIVNLPRHRRADPDLDHAVRIDQAFLDGVIEHRTVAVGLAEIVGPGVDVRIEVNECGRAAPLFSARNSGSVML